MRNRQWLATALALIQPLSATPLPITTPSNSASAHAGGSGPSGSGMISADNRWVVFASAADDLVTNDFNAAIDVFAWDVQSKENILLSVGADGRSANGDSMGPVISTNGRYVMFTSRASNLAANDTNDLPDIFVRDLALGSTELVTVNAVATRASGGGGTNPLMSSDGTRILFESNGEDLVVTDSPPGTDLFMRDLREQRTYLITSPVSGAAGLPGQVSDRVISADGRRVAYAATSPNLVANDRNNASDVFLWDGTTNWLASVNSVGSGAANGASDSPLISPDGRFVAFRSRASDIVPGVSGTNWFVRDFQTQTTSVLNLKEQVVDPEEAESVMAGILEGRRITILDGITLGTGFVEPSSFSADYRREAYVSNSGGDRTNNSSGAFQVYLHDAEHNTTNLVSKNEDGPAGWCDGSMPAVSADGRYVVFESMDGTIVPNDHNSAIDVFIYDSQEDRAELVSRRDSGRQPATANGFSWFTQGALTADAQKLAFLSWSTNLTSSDTNDALDVCVHDFATGSNLVVSAGMDGGTADGFSGDIAISGDGARAAFSSLASELVENDTNKVKDVFLKDLESGEILLISQTPAGTVANRHSYSPSISFDGKRIAFASEATDLAAFSEGAAVEDWNNSSDIFLADLETSIASVVTMSSTFPGRTAERASYNPVISPDGKWIAFLSSARDLATNTVSGTHLYLYDVAKRQNTWLGQGRTPALFSGDSRFVVFESGTDRRALGDTNGRTDIFVFDTKRGTIELISADVVGTQSGNGHSRAPGISRDGRFVTFYSAASNQVANDQNGTNDVFLRDRFLGLTTLISRGSAGSGNGPSDAPAITANGRFVVFRSSASNLTDDEVRAPGQIYSYDVVRGRMRLISRSMVEGGSANWRCGAPMISADGAKVIFKSFATDLALDDGNVSQDLFYIAHGAADIGDEDGEGMDDSWERKHFGDLEEDGLSDRDGDGVNDLDEFLIGTDPTDASSVLKAESLATDAHGAVTISWESIPGETYIIQYKDDLNQSQWMTLPEPVTAASSETAVTYTPEDLGVHRYYRILSVQ